MDQAFATSWDERLERMYRDFIDQSNKWLKENLDAQIRLMEAGYSRGAVLTPGFARLVEQYGIIDPDSHWKFGRDHLGNITIESDRPPLVPPGQVAQVVALFDPVATQFPRNYDARLPGSSISRLSLIAEDEHRVFFPHQSILHTGMTADGRALAFAVGGAHSNAGGGNRANGIDILNGNGVMDYLNTASDPPLFQKRDVPGLEQMRVQRSDLGMTGGYGLMANAQDAPRLIRDELANCKVVDVCRDSEPVNEALAARFEHRRVPIDVEELEQLQGLMTQARQRQAAPTQYAARQDDPDVPSRTASVTGAIVHAQAPS